MAIKPRLVGTWDNEGTLLFSQGFKNFIAKKSCGYCQRIQPMMHNYATAKKNEKLTFSTEVFCNLECYRKYDEHQELQAHLQG